MLFTPQQLSDQLRTFGDSNFDGYTGWPTSAEDAATRFADAIIKATSAITPPLVPGTAEAAGAAMIGVLSAGYRAGTGPAAISSALSTYAAAIGLGMQPNFTAIPSPIPLNLNLPLSNSAIVSFMNMATQIMTWFATGTAVNNSTTVTVPWA